MANASSPDPNRKGTLIVVSSTNDTDILELQADPVTKRLLVDAAVTVEGDVGELDQIDLTNSNPLAVAIVDTNGDQIASFGGGTQYTEADSDATPTGTVLMWRKADDSIVSAGDDNPLPVEATIDPTGLATEAKQDDAIALLTTIDSDTGGILTSVQTLDNIVATVDGALGGSPSGAVVLAMRDDALSTLTPAEGDAVVLRTDSVGALWATISGTVAVTQSGTWDEVGINDSGNSITVDQPTGTNLHVVTDSGTITTVSTVTSVTAIANALPAGNNNIGDVDIASIAAGNNNIGDVDIASIAAGNNNIGDVDIASGTLTTLTTLTGGGIAHDSADSGNPHKIGFKAFSPDGTTPGTAVAELDRTDAKADLDGRQYVNDEHPRFWSYHSDGSSALTDASVQADPGDGFQIVITDIIFSNGAATAINMFLEEGSTKILGPIYLEAVNGRGFVWKGKKHVTASTAVTVTTSSATAHSVDILGYIQAV